MLLRAVKEAPAQAVSKSHALLTRAGYVQQSSAGMFRMLPFAERVLAKLEAIVDEELRRAPLRAEKLRLPLVTRSELWEKSGRLGSYGEELLRFKDRRGTEFCLGPTFEEEITDLVASYGVQSSRDLPIKVYQTTMKFRDELRPRFGLLRGREFLMMDMYSFHETEACALETYADVCDAYARIFRRLGVAYDRVNADGGAIGGSITHEFQVPAEMGEDEVVYCTSGDFVANVEVAASSEGPCTEPSCSCGGNGELARRPGIEIGHTFLLGTKYAEAFAAESVDSKQRKSPLVMGCYGIGISRLMAVLIEAEGGSDEDGIIWPRAVAPFDCVVLTAPGNAKAREAYAQEARGLCDQLPESLEVVLDDRWKDSLGHKLAEAKLVGYPDIIIVGKRALDESTPQVELIDRATGEVRLLSVSEVAAHLAASRRTSSPL
ncbi:Proline--tRNA ligase [Hondaea fermentalgiana]|uniref:proline--tRNA ligase n=1 Tax=Hondaea fermentalgiana TaxID=2315210 RepID=A0A2R5FYZ8_9STRA|nr:Proline--tRNA ligase [Hondaea fermentalgiana]|eukprot:GBG23977.1 Proline--tRNA ligase [Hondaea fermentalgiana]